MSYTCRLYINSGFNTLNIPDGPGLLNTLEHVDVPTLEVLQNRDLRYIDIRTTYDGVKNADYCCIGEWFYYIDGVQMLSSDTARLTIMADYLTSAGGPSQLHILDGITSRVHVASDNYGEWQEPDPYMSPAQQPILETYRHNSSTATEQYLTVVKSTLDLSTMGDTNATKEGVTYTDVASGETVTVPKTEVNSGQDDTVYGIAPFSAADPAQPGEITPVPGESKTKLFDVDIDRIKRGLQEVNDLGINGAVTAQVALPLGYVWADLNPTTGEVTRVIGKDYYTSMVSMPFEYTGAKNKKLDYSEHTPYGLIAASGEKAEFLPSQIYIEGLTYPALRVIADPRTDGRPYFRFSVYNGDVSTEGFFSNAVTGMPWKTIPLVYEGAQGSALSKLSYAQSERRRAFEFDVAEEGRAGINPAEIGGKAVGKWASWMGREWGEISASWQVQGGILGKNASRAARNQARFESMVEAARVNTDAYQDALAARRYFLDRTTELEQLMVDTSVYVPTVQFNFSADLYNDLFRNPCIVYRYKYTDFDIARIDKILTMYGYKVTKTVEPTDFTNRQYFNFVEAAITVGNLPRWWADGIAAQLSSGVRVWHVKPDNARYTDNPIVT